MAIENEKLNEDEKRPQDTPDTSIEGGLDDINAARGDAPENVISNTHKKIADRKHGREHGEPITGANPKSI